MRGKPLSAERMKEVHDFSERRIEDFRNTMRKKREERLLVAYEKADNDIKDISERELFIV